MNALNPTERNKFWAGIMEQYKSSGLTIKNFCCENNLSFSQFRNWRCRINRDYKADKKAAFDNKGSVAAYSTEIDRAISCS